MNPEIQKLTQKAQSYQKKLTILQEEFQKIIVGQHRVLDALLISLLAKGHVLLEGVPGLAKTLMIKTLSECMDTSFVRLQFTPDLLPADIIGTKIYDHKKSTFSTFKGPIFHDFILADEINRAPPKVQSALLEAMQEHQVSIQGETFELTRPFFVMATQNPIESEGTYKLPEAQVDRFMFKLLISHPSKDDEIEIMNRFTQGIKINTKKVITVKEVLEMQDFNEHVYADETVKKYVAEIIDATRNPQNYNVDVKHYIEFGASPRASLWMILGGKAHAILQGRGYVIPEDIKAVAHDVLRHRVLLTYEAEAKKITTDDMITSILDHVRVP